MEPPTEREAPSAVPPPGEPLLPIEKQLIAVSIGLGLVLLGLLVWLTRAYA
jgi:hypothetical protein